MWLLLQLLLLQAHICMRWDDSLSLELVAVESLEPLQCQQFSKKSRIGRWLQVVAVGM